MNEATAHAYLVGLDAMKDLARLFPDWFAEHVAHRPITPSTLYGVASAFVSLVNRDLFALEDCWDLEAPRDPLSAWNHGEGDDVCLTSISQAAWLLLQPRPLMYGIGLQLMVWHTEEEMVYPRLLTVALWHMFHDTKWGLGVNLSQFLDYLNLDTEVRDYVLDLPRLSAAMPLAKLRKALGRGNPPLGDLIAYAFAQTGNAFADTSSLEIDYVYEGQTDLSWEEARGYVKDLQAAEELSRAYGHWERQVDLLPEHELDRLVQQIAHAAAAIGHPMEQQKTLIALLAERDMLSSDVDPMEALT